VAALASIGNRDGSPAYRRRTAMILLVALVSDAALLLAGPSVGGIRQRILLACGALWQLLALRGWGRDADTGDERAPRSPWEDNIVSAPTRGR